MVETEYTIRYFVTLFTDPVKSKTRTMLPVDNSQIRLDLETS